MVHMQHIDVEVHTRAAAKDVYALLQDGASWPRWTGIDSFQREAADDGVQDRVGAIRVFRKGRITGRDQIAELIPDRRFSYRHVSGLPVRDYRGDVDLEPVADGTRIRWRVAFRPKVPGTGWLLRWGIERFTKQNARGLAAYAQTITVRER
ncbi:MAG: SRPBCC family protein [Pseudonocardiaceae bacterium]